MGVARPRIARRCVRVLASLLLAAGGLSGLAGLATVTAAPAGAAAAVNEPVIAASLGLDGAHGFASVSCVPGGTFCLAVENSGTGTTNSWTYSSVTNAWTGPAVVTGEVHTVTAVSCASSTFCVAVDGNGGSYFFNGAWTGAAGTGLTGAGAFASVSCTANGGGDLCAAVAAGRAFTTTTGSTWTAATGNPIDGANTLNSISCPTTGYCLAVDSGRNYVNVTCSGATCTWGSVTSTGKVSTFNVVSCAPSASSVAVYCVAIDANKDFSIFTGTGVNGSWGAVSASVVDAAGNVKSLTCPAVSFCIIVDDAGNDVFYTGTGTAWSTPLAVAAGKTLVSVSCISTALCAMVDSVAGPKGDTFVWGGTTWLNPPSWVNPVVNAGGGPPIKSISCPTAIFCMAVDNGFKFVTYNGTIWSAPAAVTGAANPLVSVSCISSIFCAAVDNIGKGFFYNGTIWSADAGNPISGSAFASVSCVTGALCAAVDVGGNAFTSTDGKTWTAAVGNPIDAGPIAFNSVSCPATTFCLATDVNGKFLECTSNANCVAGTWVAAVATGDANSLLSVSCTSSSFCMAVDNAKNTVTCTTGAQCSAGPWNAAAASGDANPLVKVRCLSTTYCVVVDNAGSALILNGTAFTTYASADTSASAPSGLSCATVTFCVVVDAGGNAFQIGSVANAPSPAGGTVTSTSTPGTVTVTWNAVTANGTAVSNPEFVLSYEDQTTGKVTSATAVSSPATVAGLTVGHSYSFYVATLDPVGVSSEDTISTNVAIASGTPNEIWLAPTLASCASSNPPSTNGANLSPAPATPSGLGNAGSFADMGPFYVCLEDTNGNPTPATQNTTVTFLPFQHASFTYVSGVVFASQEYGPPVTGITVTAGSDFAGPVWVGSSQAVNLDIWGNVGSQGFTCGFGNGYDCSTATANFGTGTSVKAPTVAVAPADASSTASYTVTFTAADGVASGGAILIDASLGAAGTVFPPTAADYVISDISNPSGSGTVAVTPKPFNSGASVAAIVPATINPGDEVQIAISGATNPSTNSSAYFLDVSTSNDGAAVPTNDYAIGPAQSMSIVTGNGQSTQLGQPFGSVLSVKVADAQGKPLQNVAVTFTAPGSGPSGTFQGSGSSVEVDQSNSNGIASSSTFVANLVGGTYSVTATATGLPTQTFTLTNGSSSVISTVNSAVVASPATVPANGVNVAVITVTLENGSKVPVQGKTITVSAASGTSARVVAVSAVTNSSGVATFNATDTKAETVVFTAKDATDVATINEQATVIFTASPVVAITPLSLSFASQAVGTTSSPQSVTFDNTGDEALTIFTVKVSGPDQTDFEILPPPASTCNGTQIPQGQSCSVAIAFKPVGTGTRIATLTLVDNAVPSTQSFSATGTGTAGKGPVGSGYWLAGSNGALYNFGAAGSFGSAAGIPLVKPVVGIASTSDQGGYWMVASDGGVFAFGDAVFYGSMGGQPLNRPIVGITATPDGRGYWMVASDGGVFSYGDAVFYGSTGDLTLDAPVHGMASTPDGRGYWMVASDGGIFSFGDASFYGSMARKTAAPVVGMAPTADSLGYWLVDSAGDVYNLGDATYFGSVAAPAVAVAGTPDGRGYWVLTSAGKVIPFGDAGFGGDTSTQSLAAPIVGFSTAAT